MLDETTIVAWVDQLARGLGVRESVSLPELLQLLRDGNRELCAEVIARQLLLPVTVRLLYTTQFDSNQLCRTGPSGQGEESICAQVPIPVDLPLFGSSSLTGFPITVKVSPSHGEDYDTWITVICHELSHVVLFSVRHPQARNEVFTDLTAMVLGFSEIMRTGRKSTRISDGEHKTREETGYLPDPEFEWAYGRICQLLARYRESKGRVASRVASADTLVDACERTLFKFRRYLEYVDKNRPTSMKKEDAFKVLTLHQPGYADDIEQLISSCKAGLADAAVFLKGLRHYTDRSLSRLGDCSAQIDQLCSRLDRARDSLATDVKTLGNYVGVVYKVRTAIMKTEPKR